MIAPTTPILPDTLGAIIETLMTAIEARDADLRRHSERVARFAVQVALDLGLDKAAQHQIHLGALLHDIGNIGIPDSILLKPSVLTSWEFDEMKLHGIIGETICRPLPDLAPALSLIRSHHEKLDGTGYPDALSGDQIGVAVRVLSVVDVYDTLRCERAYRDAFTHEQAIEILHQEAGRGWWDAQIVARFAGLNKPSA